MAGGCRRNAGGTHMRLLGEIFRPSRNQVTWGWGKLAMRGARMTAASPWDTLCCASLSSKLPMSAKCVGEPCQGPGRGWQRAWGRSRVRSRVRLGSRLEATGMGSPRGCRGAALGSALCSPPRLGACARTRIHPHGTQSCTAPSPARQTGDSFPCVPHRGWGAAAARRAQPRGSPASLPAQPTVQRREHPGTTLAP